MRLDAHRLQVGWTHPHERRSAGVACSSFGKRRHAKGGKRQQQVVAEGPNANECLDPLYGVGDTSGGSDASAIPLMMLPNVANTAM